MMTADVYSAISNIEPISPRIMQISFNGNPKLTIFVCYSPTEGDSSDIAEDFHNTLRHAVSNIPAHNLLLVIGDFNSHLGKDHPEDTGVYYHSTTNRNGHLLRDTLLECRLVATNHCFQKRHGKLWTFLSDATGTKSQIDYILIRKKWRNSIKNTEPYNFFGSIG